MYYFQQKFMYIIILNISLYTGFLSSMKTSDSKKLSQSMESYDLNMGEDNDIDRFNFTKSMESLKNQEHIQSLVSQKRVADAIYGTFILITATATICNVIWDELTLNNSDYFNLHILSIENKINTAVTLGLSITDIIWLLKPYCTFSNDALQEDTWTDYIMGMHLVGGISRGVIATMIGAYGGIQRYPRTLTTLIGTALLDFAGVLNVEKHIEIDQEIEELQSIYH